MKKFFGNIATSSCFSSNKFIITFFFVFAFFALQGRQPRVLRQFSGKSLDLGIFLQISETDEKTMKFFKNIAKSLWFSSKKFRITFLYFSSVIKFFPVFFHFFICCQFPAKSLDFKQNVANQMPILLQVVQLPVELPSFYSLISPNHNAFQLYAQAEITFQPQTINNLDNNKLAVAYLVKTIPTQQLIEDHALLKLAHQVNTVITLDNANNVQEVHHTCKPQMVSHVFKSNAHQLTNTLTTMEIAHHVEHTRLLISKEVDVLHQHAMIDKL